MGNAKSRNYNKSNKIEKQISRNLKSTKLTTTATTYRKEDNNSNVGGTTTITTTATTTTNAANSTVGGPWYEEVGNKTTASSNKALKDPQQLAIQQQQQHYKHKAADNSAASAVAEQQRLKQASSLWSLGSLNWNLSYSVRNSFKQRQKSSRKSFSTLQQYQQRKRSKTQWHKPLTNAIFSSHFKESSRNEEFHIDQLVAKGAFGVVFKVIDKKSLKQEEADQQQQQQQHQAEHINKNNFAAFTAVSPSAPVYALKVLKKSKIISENSLQQIKDEVDIQKLCGHHPFIVKQFDLWQNRYNLHILSEYIPNGELFSTIRTFSLNLIRLYLAEIALALDFLHNAGIIYRDAKPENILLTQDYHIKLTDFGLSKWLKLGLTTKTMCGTFQYMVFDLTMEGRQVDEAVASIFHTVLFHRCLGKYMYTGDAQYSIGTVGYTDVDCDFIDFTYVCCTSDSLQRTVNRAINVFSEKLRSNESCGSGQISLEFFQKKKSRWPFTAECIPWEVWTIHLDLIKHENEDERQMCRENVADLLTEKVIYITEIMNRHDYVPKTPSQSELDLIFDTTYPDVQPYLFKFVYSTSDTAAPSMGNAVKKIIKETLAL